MIDNTGQPRAVWQYLSAAGNCNETGKVLLPPTGTDDAYLYNPLSDGNNDLVWRAQVKQPAGLQPNAQWRAVFAQNIYGKGAWNYDFAYTAQKAFVIDPQNARHLLVGADQVYETTNADSLSPAPTWKPIGPPVPTGQQTLYVTAIAIAPSATNYVYVATRDQHVYLTTQDGGTSWMECDSGLYNPNNVGPVLSMSIDPNNPSHVFAVSSQWWGTAKVWELGSASTLVDNPCNETWANRSGPANLTVYSIVADWQYSDPNKQIPPNLYVASDRGVYKSTDDGQTWNSFGSGLPNAQVFDLQSAPWGASPATSVLVAATYGRGGYEIALPEPAPAPKPPPLLRRPISQTTPWISPMRPPWAEGKEQPVPPGIPAQPQKPKP